MALVNATLLFLRPEDILRDEHARWPQRCVPGNATALSNCADGGVRDQVSVPIFDDARDHSLLESGFEVVKLRPSGILSMLEQLRREGLSGAESPGAAVSTTPWAVLGQMLMPQRPAAADTAIARAIEGSRTYSLRGVLFAGNFRCSGIIIRRAGPKLTAPIDEFHSWDSSARSRESSDSSNKQAAAWPQPLDHAGDMRLPSYTPHVDQDVLGEPLTSMGLSWLFAKVPFVRLLNVWIPFAEVPVRPLSLMDVRSLNRRADLVVYRASFKINSSKPTDVLLLRHGVSQQWHYDSLISAGDALVRLGLELGT